MALVYRAGGCSGSHGSQDGAASCPPSAIFRPSIALPVTMLTITTATPADLPAVVALIRKLAAFERLPDLCVVKERDLAAVLFAPSPTVEVVLARFEGDIVGFALFFHNFSTFLGRRGLYLEDLYVLEEYRRRGYGKALLVHLAKLAVARGCGRFEWSVLDWNAPAIAFYRSLGAQVLPDWRITRMTGDALQSLARSESVDTSE
jgi:GNAT superfamily N-acetyltransferase